MADSYRGVFGAIPYAIRHTDSWTMRVYGVVGALAAALISLVVTLALVVWMGETAEMDSGLFLFSRSLYVIAGFAAVAPLIAPMLFVARRHRRDDPVADNYDRVLAYTGFVFLVSLYVGMVISAPADLRDPSGSVIVNALYALPPLAGLVPPVLAGTLVFVAHRRLRRPDATDSDAVGSDAGSSVDRPAAEPEVGVDDDSRTVNMETEGNDPNVAADGDSATANPETGRPTRSE
ncbi:hypothetical protein SAMN06264855_10436 [Halorubrum vacuolatum]|uniref:DUF8056 domain-containing protein n=1 Tax=Halorubrum vacuolatum TaxID=63740 RepID=A0A238VSX3_HALVU|nr:hypothetical protein SAMN06264855_10436 [Halorubrum vacuolatum]